MRIPIAAPLVCSLLLVLFASLVFAAPGTDSPATHRVTLGDHKFTLREGFDIEIIAGPPLVDRPIHADFDDRGRLYVCEASGTNDPVEKQLQDRPHWIVRLEDADGDGRFDRRTKFADKMMFPEGMLWREGSIYVAAPPSIWKLEDTDDDGVAERREEWFNGKTLTHAGNDLHGPYAGPDGLIYWCKGAFAEQTYARPGKSPLVTRAAHIFRSRADASGIEPVMTGGMDNPVEVVFTPGGERIFTTTFLQHPAGGRRDGLIHAVYGGVYGKDHKVIDGHPRTGDLMPVLAHLGAAAPAGLARYESRVFGAEYEGNLFATSFNLHKVTRHVLTRDGATFVSRDEDFLVADSLDFHPTEVLEDADGSLLVINTGGWYKLACPTSQLWKPEILGGIYRIRRQGAPRVADPRGLAIAWSESSHGELARLLDDGRPAVARRAVRELARRGSDSVSSLSAVLRDGPSAAARCRAVWALSQMDGAPARVAARAALADKDETVRQAAIHTLSVARDVDAVPQLIDLVKSGTAHNRRAAAEALGRCGRAAAVPVLLSVAGESLDRTLEHSVTFALIEIADPAATTAGLTSANARTRRAALLAVDQMDKGALEPAAVAALLESDDPGIRSTAKWIIGRHANWNRELAPGFSRQIDAGALAGARGELLAELLPSLAADAGIQSSLAARLQHQDAGPVEQTRILTVMAESRLKKLPPAWATALCQVANQETLAPRALAVLQAIPVAKDAFPDLRSALLAAAANGRLPVAVRLAALNVVPGGLARPGEAEFRFLREHLSAEMHVSLRMTAADALSKARLDDGQLLELAGAVRTASPLEIERLIAPFGRGASSEVGQALISALGACPAIVTIRPETLRDVFKPYPRDVQDKSQTLHDLLAASSAQRMLQMTEVLALVPKGDVRRGQSVYHSQKAACTSCHAMGYLGGAVGPDLTRIGSIRSERDLLEAILFPSASFVRNYEPVTISTTAGKVYNGVIRSDAPDEVVLTLSATESVRIAREEIDQMAPSAVSIMPTGLDKQLTPSELADLVAFLKASK